MRTVLALLAIALLAPVALADQNVGAGPATATTTNATWGDGSCEAGGNGGVSRDANVRVVLTAHESLFVDLASSCSSYSWDDGRGDWQQMTFHSLYLTGGRQTDDAVGPFASVGWFDTHDDSSWGGDTHYCGSQAYASGPALYPGCWPDGDAPPMLPVLP